MCLLRGNRSVMVIVDITTTPSSFQPSLTEMTTLPWDSGIWRSVRVHRQKGSRIRRHRSVRVTEMFCCRRSRLIRGIKLLGRLDWRHRRHRWTFNSLASSYQWRHLISHRPSPSRFTRTFAPSGLPLLYVRANHVTIKLTWLLENSTVHRPVRMPTAHSEARR